MEATWKATLWQQLGAAIDMLGNTVEACPDEELLLYNMRHVQHHTGQLNLILRQKTGSAPRWVAQAR